MKIKDREGEGERGGRGREDKEERIPITTIEGASGDYEAVNYKGMSLIINRECNLFILTNNKHSPFIYTHREGHTYTHTCSTKLTIKLIITNNPLIYKNTHTYIVYIHTYTYTHTCLSILH